MIFYVRWFIEMLLESAGGERIFESMGVCVDVRVEMKVDIPDDDAVCAFNCNMLNKRWPFLEENACFNLFWVDVGGRYTTIKFIFAPWCSTWQFIYSKYDTVVSMWDVDTLVTDSPVLNMIPTPPPILPVFRGTW